MDLNRLYSRHQRALMRAEASNDCAHRAGHLACARDAARQIAAHQQGSGATAASGWRRVAA